MLREIYPITVVESDKGSSSILSPTGMAGDEWISEVYTSGRCHCFNNSLVCKYDKV